MSLTLYAHPFSSYCQKVLVALYENDVPFEYRTLEDPSAMAELKARWPFARFPILVDDGRTIVESTIIIEHLMLKHGGRVRWLPDDPLEALEVRFLDRFFDNDVMTAMQKPVFEAIKKNNARKDEAMAEAKRVLDLAYGWLERRLEGRAWAAGETMSLADCAAAPSLSGCRLVAVCQICLFEDIELIYAYGRPPSTLRRRASGRIRPFRRCARDTPSDRYRRVRTRISMIAPTARAYFSIVVSVGRVRTPLSRRETAHLALDILLRHAHRRAGGGKVGDVHLQPAIRGERSPGKNVGA